MRILVASTLVCSALLSAQSQPVLGSRTARELTVQGLKFRDLNRNGVLDAYEDWRRPIAERVNDLVRRMTIEEKAGAIMHGTVPAIGGPGGMSSRGYDLAGARELMEKKLVNSMISRLSLPTAALAAQNNELQAIAESTRLGIPLTLSTDPRHHFLYVPGASIAAQGFSQWPETLGFGALKDAALVRSFGEIARQEYRATGFHMALSPQADLATEPRWPRVTGAFGEDPELVRNLTQAYVEGFQGGAEGLNRNGVATVVKHWAGYGAAKDGWDSHSYYGRYASISEKAFEAHVRAFTGAFASKVAGVMPTYSILENLSVKGKAVEQVGGGYNRWLLTDLLRGEHRFDGIVISDWAITNDCGDLCKNGGAPGGPPNFRGIAMPWGVEELTAPEKFAKGLNAGIDQFGGTEESGNVLEAVKKGLVSSKRIDEAVARVLTVKFQLGLFENPYATGGAVDDGGLGRKTQARAMVLLENKHLLLPLAAGRRVFLHGVDAAAAKRAGFMVASTAEEADVAVIRTATPHQVLHPGFFFGARQHEGDLDFKADHPDLQMLQKLKIPAVVAIYLDRPAILTNVVPLAGAVVANFGATDDALFDVLTGRVPPEGRLPFELPRSMEAVRKQRPDLPFDSADPLYQVGAGKSYR